MYIVVYKVMFDIFEGKWLMFIDKKRAPDFDAEILVILSLAS